VKEKRFECVYSQGTMDSIRILVDKKTESTICKCIPDMPVG
jgi:hypothetical protein